MYDSEKEELKERVRILENIKTICYATIGLGEVSKSFRRDFYNHIEELDALATNRSNNTEGQNESE